MVEAEPAADPTTPLVNTMKAYNELLKELDTIRQLSRVSSILGYDKVRQ